MKEEIVSEGIDWGLFESSWVKLEDSEPKDLVLSGWTQTTEEFKNSGEEVDALKFTVLEEDGQECDKTFTVTSKRLASELKEHVVNAVKAKKDRFKVRICRSGKGFSTTYSVKGLTL